MSAPAAVQNIHVCRTQRTLSLTLPHSTSEYEYAVLPRKFSSSGRTVNSEGYTPLTVAGNVTNLFLPRLSFTVTGFK